MSVQLLERLPTRPDKAAAVCFGIGIVPSIKHAQLGQSNLEIYANYFIGSTLTFHLALVQPRLHTPDRRPIS
jgi:hypothetical protein